MILVVSHPADDHAVGVLDELERIGHPAVLFDTATFPSRGRVRERFGAESPRFEYSMAGDTVDLSSCGAAWWRRPQAYTLAEGMAEDVAGFAYAESHEAIAGLWAALDVTWVNKPDLDEIAHHKPYQLTAATQVGLPIPRTLITNDPVAAREFVDELGAERTIYKTFLATQAHWRETRQLRPDELELLDRVELAPVIFQEFVPAVADIRVTVMGDRFFPTAISAAPNGYQLDYRMDMDGARFEPTTLAPETERLLRALMARLGLVYGAIDLRRRPDGREVFLEINPAGEWRFVEERTGQSMTRAMAELLVSLDLARLSERGATVGR